MDGSECVGERPKCPKLALHQMKKYRIAAIQGDGIGKEVVPEGIRVIDVAARKAGIQFEWQQFPWSCA